jgi:predicted AAA+ superfamily ATPase
MNESTIIADKSEFVSEFMEGIDGNPYIIVTLPRKSGKSVLLETVAYFIKDRGLHEAFQATASIWVCFSEILKLIFKIKYYQKNASNLN